jgi:hypothetical protein
LTDVSVVIPLDDARGDAIEHLRTWTHGQTLDRDRYQLVLVSDGADAAGDQRIAELLQSHDRFLTSPDAGLMDLWDEGVREADSDWLLLTENHVEALPDTLERAVEGIVETPGLDAASIEHGHIAPTPTGELGVDWFDQVYGEWYSPGNWRRLNLAGYVIRRDVYDGVGGLDDRYSLFAAPLLSARLADGGARVGHIGGARILHVQPPNLQEHHRHSADYARGECEARLSLDPAFAERYFGHQHLVWNRHGLDPAVARRRCGIVARQALRRPREARPLVGEIRSQVLSAFAGPRAELALTRWRLAWAERVAAARSVPRERRYGTFLKAQELAARRGQLEWIEGRGADGGARVGPGLSEIEEVGEGALIGVHGLEQENGRSFRWSEPVLTARLDGAAERRELRIDSGGLRGSPSGCLTAAYAGGRRVDGGIRSEGDVLVIPVAPGVADLTLLFRRLLAPRDGRRLGLPIFSLELSAEAQAAGQAAPAVEQPAG